MIERNTKTLKWEVTCDSCPDEFLEIDGDLEFGEVVKHIVGEGWTVQKLFSTASRREEWYHTCLGCGAMPR